jgi:hypothetical protein
MPIIRSRKSSLKNSKNDKRQGVATLLDFDNVINAEKIVNLNEGVKGDFIEYQRVITLKNLRMYCDKKCGTGVLQDRQLVTIERVAEDFIKILIEKGILPIDTAMDKSVISDDLEYAVEGYLMRKSVLTESPYLEHASRLLECYRIMAIHMAKGEFFEATSMVGNVQIIVTNLVKAEFDKEITSGHSSNSGGAKIKDNSEREIASNQRKNIAMERAKKLNSDNPKLSKTDIAKRIIKDNGWMEKPDTVARYFKLK